MLAFVLSSSLALAPVPTALSPEAGEHNAKAMTFYDNGQLAPAFDEFKAAYDVMPDARRDRAGRELLLGSMRATLLELHEASRDPEPLCHLQAILQSHADALTAAYPEAPDMLEIRGARARHEEVTRQLAAIGPDACTPPPVPTSISTPSTSAPSPAPGTEPVPTQAPRSPADAPIPPRQLRIAGGVTLGLSAALLGAMTYGIVIEAQRKAQANEIDADAAARPLTQDEYSRLLDLRGDALSARYLAIGTGVAAGVSAALGTTLLVLARRSKRAQRLSLAPWWSHTGGGLTLHVRLGTAH